MPWTYSQSTGHLTHDSVPVGVGYSGAGHDARTGRNNPEMEMIGSRGPIPQGQWSIGRAHHHPHLGPTIMGLLPVGHIPYYRDLFRIHGNNSANDASHGCIILGPTIRHQIANSADKILNVVP